MIRFTSTQLRPVLSLNRSFRGPVILEKNNGICLHRPDFRRLVTLPLAWAEGCNPFSDNGCRKLSDSLIADETFSHQFDLSQNACDAVLNEHQDLLITFICQTPGAVRVFAETGEPEKVYLPVGIYRERISWLYDQSLRHFHSCVGNAERLSWRSQALNVLDRVIRLDSKRAKPSDRQMLASAVQDVRKRISQISSDGSLRFYS